MRRVRGAQISMVFQDPLSSLHPQYRVGRQIVEAIRAHERISRAEAEQRAIALLEEVGLVDAGRRINDYPHQFSGRHAPAGDAGDGAGPATEAADRRRTDHRPRRHGAGPTARPAGAAAARPRHRHRARHPRPRRDRRGRRPRAHDVRRTHRRAAPARPRCSRPPTTRTRGRCSNACRARCPGRRPWCRSRASRRAWCDCRPGARSHPGARTSSRSVASACRRCRRSPTGTCRSACSRRTPAPAASAVPVAVAAAGHQAADTSGTALLRATDLVKHFAGPPTRAVRPPPGRARRRWRGARGVPGRDPRPRRRVRVGQVDPRPAAGRADRADGGHRRDRRQGPRRARPAPAADAAARRAGDLPGPLRVAQPASPRRVDHRRPARDPRRAVGRRGAARRRADGPRRAQPGAPQPLSGRLLRRSTPAHRHRPGVGARPQPGDLRRAGVGPRRVRAGADRQPAATAAARAVAHLRRRVARPRGDRQHRRPRRRDVPRPDRRDRRHRAAVRRAAAPVHPGPARRGAGSRPHPGPRPRPRRRRRAVAALPSDGLRVPSALPARHRPLPRRGAGARGPDRRHDGPSRGVLPSARHARS